MRQRNDLRLVSIVDGLAYAEDIEANYALVMRGTTAHVRVRGSLGSYTGKFWSQSTYRSLSAALEQARTSDEVERIVLSIDSPGGEIDGLFECARMILETRKEKPILALIEGMGCSAAYLVAACCTRVVATPYSEVGSCGVQAETYDWSKWEEKAGIISRIFHSRNAQKKNLSPSTEEGAAAIQERIDYAEDGYFSLIAEGRGIDKEKCIEAFGHGAVLKAEDALAAGMIDAIQTLDEAVESFEADGGTDLNNSLLRVSEGEGADMTNVNQSAAGAALDEQQIKAAAAQEERRRIKALGEWRTGCTAQIIDQAIESGATPEAVSADVIKALMGEVTRLGAEAQRMEPIKAQAEAQTPVAGLPGQQEIDREKAAMDEIEKAAKVVEGGAR